MKPNTPRVYALAGIKGGIAKTATALTLARVMAGQGRRVAFIDHDPQGSATSYLLPDIGPEDITGTALELIQGKPAPILPTIIDRVGCLPASLTMLSADMALARDPGAVAAYRSTLATHCAEYDAVLIDTPPALGSLLLAALYAADVVLSPCQPDPWTIQGLFMLAAEMDKIRGRGHNAELIAVPAAVTAAEADRLRDWLAPDLFANTDRKPPRLTRQAIPKSASIRRAALRGDAPAGSILIAALELLEEIEGGR